MKKWRCTVCGEIVESETRPEKCPLCKAPGDKFVEIKEDAMTWATEHVVGIAKDAPAEIIEGLRANFNGECTEVGMYLAMSRVAAREGYPEIAEYWKTAAFEEAEHAAKFAELLGECVSDSTEKNLKARVEPKTELQPESLSWQKWQSRTIWMQFMTRFMKWQRTKPVTAVLLQACLRDISANNFIKQWLLERGFSDKLSLFLRLDAPKMTCYFLTNVVY